jgi:hypothetical protein
MSPLLSSARESINGGKLYEKLVEIEAPQGLQFSLRRTSGELESSFGRTDCRRLWRETTHPPLLMAKAVDQLSGNSYTPGGSLAGEDFSQRKPYPAPSDTEFGGPVSIIAVR